MPRRARHLIPTQLPRRGEAIAACAVLAVLAHLLFAQLTLILAVTFIAVGKATRWRSWWLALPAVAGLTWTVTIGPSAAAAGFAAGPVQVLSYLDQGGHPLSHLLQPRGAFAGAGTWLPRQFPLALIVAAAEAALAGWLAWVHTDEWAVPPRRPGAFAAVRSAATKRAIRAGAVVTRDGCALGVAQATGGPVELSWQEVAGGVLVTGDTPEVATTTSFQLVYAALRRRKPVITVDMTGDAAVARAMATACAATGTPLRVFGAADGYYEPFRAAGPARRLAMALALLGIDEAGDQSARGMQAYLRAVFEMIDAVPGDARTPVLDDVLHLLNPLAMQARLRLVPSADPRRDQLADLVRACTGTAQAEPAAALTVARRLAALRRSPAGRRLCPGEGIDLSRVVRERSAALFHVDMPELAHLVRADLVALGEDLRSLGVDGDGLIWLCGRGPLSAQQLAGLVTGGADGGLPVLVAATPPAATDLAALVNALLVHRLDDAAAAAHLAARCGTRMVPGAPGAPGAEAASAASAALAAGPELVARPAVAAQTLLSLGPAQFVLAVHEPAYRLVQRGQAVPARLPRGAVS